MEGINESNSYVQVIVIKLDESLTDKKASELAIELLAQ